MIRQWSQTDYYARQWYGLDGEIEATFDLNGKLLHIVDLRPDVEMGTVDPIMVKDFRQIRH